MSTEVMNSTRVWAARELRLSDAASTSLLTETATNSRPGQRAGHGSERFTEAEPHRGRVPHRTASRVIGLDRRADSIRVDPHSNPVE